MEMMSPMAPPPIFSSSSHLALQCRHMSPTPTFKPFFTDAAASASIYWSRGDIHTLIAAPVAIGVLAGAYLGTALMARMRNTTVRKLFLPVVVYLALSMIVRGLGLHLP